MQSEQQAIQEVLANLRIENACPMILAQMRGETDTEYYCKSCDKTIVDFTSCSDEEIVAELTSKEDVCGIFYEHQLKGQHQVRYNFFQNVAFYALVFFAFIGFSVKPLNAQTSQTNKTNASPQAVKDSSLTNVAKHHNDECSSTSEKKIKTIKIGWRQQPIHRKKLKGKPAYNPRWDQN